MEFGIILWCLLTVFFGFTFLYSKIKKARTLIEYFSIRILAEIATESIDEERTKKVFKKLIREALREELSEMYLKKLDNDDRKN